MLNFGYPYNDIVICRDSTDYLAGHWRTLQAICPCSQMDDGELGPLPSRPPLILISKGEAPASTDTPLHL